MKTRIFISYVLQISLWFSLFFFWCYLKLERLHVMKRASFLSVCLWAWWVFITSRVEVSSLCFTSSLMGLFIFLFKALDDPLFILSSYRKDSA